MAVLLSYHRLIEKDSRNVNYCWKVSIIVALFIAIGSSLVLSFSMESLLESYNHHCFMNATLVFDRINNDTSQERVQGNSTHENYVINVVKSSWNYNNLCEYLTYTPLVHALAGVICLAMFTMHGHGGDGIGSIIPKPWRIVFPSLIFFAVCCISALVCASWTSEGLAGLCRQFDHILDRDRLGCANLIKYYALPSDVLVPPDRNYFLLVSFPWIWVGSYVCAVAIMILRVVLVVDFQLIRVVVSTVEQSEDQQQSYELVDDTVLTPKI